MKYSIYLFKRQFYLDINQMNFKTRIFTEIQTAADFKLFWNYVCL